MILHEVISTEKVPFHYRVALRNMSKYPFRFAPCPVYSEGLLSAWPRAELHVLNCRPAVMLERLNLHEETFGLEKTFLSGVASLGIRVPYIQPESAEFLGPTQVGDLTLISKYAFYNDRETGDGALPDFWHQTAS